MNPISYFPQMNKGSSEIYLRILECHQNHQILPALFLWYETCQVSNHACPA